MLKKYSKSIFNFLIYVILFYLLNTIIKIIMIIGDKKLGNGVLYKKKYRAIRLIA